MADLHADSREIARQAARNKVAEHYDQQIGGSVIADEVRAGRCDDEPSVRRALAIADAAHAAVLAAVVRAAEIDLRSVEIPSAMADDPVQAHAWLAAMLAARERLLALLEKDTQA